MRIALIGTGDVARRDYLSQMHRLKHDGRVVLAVGRDPGRLRQVAVDFAIPETSRDWRAVLRDDIDVVINLTPPAEHDRINLELASHGKHFHSEKPFATSYAAGLAIAEAIARSVVSLAPAVMLFPQVVKAMEMLSAGAIGKLFSARATATASPPPWAGNISDPGPYFSGPAAGPLPDIGIYALHAIVGMLGSISQVAALSGRSRDAFTVLTGPYANRRVAVEVDDNWQIVMRAGDGLLVSLQTSYCVTHPSSCELEIAGDEGTLSIALLDPRRPLRLFDASGVERIVPVTHQRPDGPDHFLGVAHLMNCIAFGTSPKNGIREALHVLQVIEAVGQSRDAGHVLAVRSMDDPERRFFPGGPEKGQRC